MRNAQASDINWTKQGLPYLSVLNTLSVLFSGRDRWNVSQSTMYIRDVIFCVSANHSMQLCKYDMYIQVSTYVRVIILAAFYICTSSPFFRLVPSWKKGLDLIDSTLNS